MGLIIDTSVLINIEHERLNPDILNEHDDVFIAAVTVSELLVGVHMTKRTDTRIKRSVFVEAIISGLPILDFTAEVARVYAEVHASLLRSRGKKESDTHDLQIGATALTYDYPVLTHNVTDFKKVPGLKVISP